MNSECGNRTGINGVIHIVEISLCTHIFIIICSTEYASFGNTLESSSKSGILGSMGKSALGRVDASIANVKTVTGEVQIQALVDKKKVIVTEASNWKEWVLDLENTKTSQAVEITELKKRVKKLEGKRKPKPRGIKRLFKIGRSAQVVSSEDDDLGDQEDASK
ncbi:hypothetical protein Tco_0813896, partial [Tanacetum coccineum]